MLNKVLNKQCCTCNSSKKNDVSDFSNHHSFVPGTEGNINTTDNSPKTPTMESNLQITSATTSNDKTNDQLVSVRKRKHEQYMKSNREKKVVKFADAVERSVKNVVLIGDSMLNGIKRKRFVK